MPRKKSEVKSEETVVDNVQEEVVEEKVEQVEQEERVDDTVEVQEIKPEDLKSAIDDLKKREAERPKPVKVDEPAVVKDTSTKKGHLHKTGLDGAGSGRKFYFGGYKGRR